MSTKEHSLLVEKYRSKDLTEYVGNEHIKTQIQKYLDQDDIQNFIFYGPAGTGKTTLAKIIVNNLECDYLYINASDERGIETIRDKVTSFSSTASFKKIKVVILDEADFLTIQAQASLRNTILNKEQTEFELKALANIVNQHHPDIRKMLNIIQLSTKDNELVVDESILVSSNYIKQIIEELKLKKTDFRKLRQIIADSQVRDFEELYRALFDHASEYAIGREGSIAIILNEHQYHSNFRIDKEVNIASALAKIIEIKKPQVI